LHEAMLRVRAIILDLDGTIVDSKEAYLEAARMAFASVGKKLVDAAVATEIPKRLEQNLSLDDLVRRDDMEKFLETYLRAYYRATAERSEPFPNIAETLKKLSRNAKLALVTRRHVSKKEVIDELVRFGLAKYFQLVKTALDTENPKPSPDAMIETSKQLGVSPSECLIVGDSVVDVRAGKKVGAGTVAVLSGIFTREELEREQPDLILENVSKLPDFLE
jgi:phosphoglycolate phosphatase